MVKRKQNRMPSLQAASSGDDILAKVAKAPGVAEMAKLAEAVRGAEEAMRPVTAVMGGQLSVVQSNSSTFVGTW